MLFTLPDHTGDKHLFLGTGAKPRIHTCSKPNENCTAGTNSHTWGNIKQLLDEVVHDIMNYQNRGLCYLPKPKASADNTDTRFW